jgi:orotate phosphoribosyltransferase
MSHIPNSAMPHAAVKPESDATRRPRKSLSGRAGELAEKMRENPKTAAAAGAAIAGVIAAAAIPMVRSARAKPAKAAPKRSGAKKSTAKKTS